jgi:hypothetical protein
VRYSDAAAFRQALEQRLKNAAATLLDPIWDPARRVWIAGSE